MRFIILLITLSICLTTPVLGKSPENDTCNYEKYPVKIKITSVKQLASSDSTKYEIRFEVLATEKLPPIAENRVYGRDFQMLLKNKTFPGPLFLKKYDISPDKVFNCDFHVLTRGYCRRNFFEFPEIRLDDYSGG